jgi:uncharacterized protein (TIGR02145 family)
MLPPHCDGICDGSITGIQVTGGTPPYTFLWSNGTTTADNMLLCPDTYVLTVTDAYNCQFTGTWIVGVSATPCYCPGVPVVLYEGQTYNTIQIGTQCWLKENLNVGTIVSYPENQSNNGIIEKFCVDCDIYGGLYQWNEMMQYQTTPGVQGICPNGWHLPTIDEWSVLSDFLGGEAIAGGKMKEPGLEHWTDPNVGATNESGFTALPGGYYWNPYYFAYYTTSAMMWTSTESNSVNARSKYIWNSDVFLGGLGFSKNDGRSVRCIKN